jgi:hypothetical protein
LDEILEFFKDEDDKDINNSLLHLINHIDGDIDKYFEFILNEFLRIFKINKRVGEDKYLSSKIIIEDIILRINDSENLMKILYYILNGKKNYRANFEDRFVLQIFEKCRVIASLDINFIDKILELINKRRYWDLRENELVKLFTSTNSSVKIIEKAINNEIMLNDSKYLIARLLSNDSINLITDKFINEKTERDGVEFFRNIIGNTNDRNLALSFEKTMVENGYVLMKST